ncbi:MAG: DNA (cytosine-5-)-methyltransferase [Nanoarchaeota archaeon]|nr:DNA (cytosine-5-)-methyltransferase [Nanoarchaeota archaeon]
MGRLKVVSLFSGCGGTEVGLLGGFSFLNKSFKKHPLSVVFANDNEQSACNIYNENFNHSILCDDIKNISEQRIPDHDILVGGFPCQSFSIVAQNPPRLGFKSEKGKLFFEMIRLLKEKKPKMFIAENVKGILSANKKQAFPLILKEFKKAGYEVDYKLLNASEYGVPQKRERVFIMGFRKDLDIFPSFPKPTNLDKPIPLQNVIFDHNKVSKKYFFSDRAHQGLLNANPQMNKGRAQDELKPCNTVTAHLAKVSLNSTDPVIKVNGKFRRFTPREVARIQSFPDDFKLVGSDAQIYKSLGNAIPPVLMWHVTNHAINLLNGEIKEEKTKLTQYV